MGKVPKAHPHLVLNFDINKTIVMVDTAKNQPISDVLNGILSECTWGEEVECDERSPVEAGWRAVNSEPSVLRFCRPEEHGGDTLSYLEYLGRKLPGKEAKKQREKMYKDFTKPGHPGESFRHHYKSMKSRLLGRYGSLAGGPKGDGPKTQIIQAFFELVVDLVRRGRSFSIVFRTFGKDLPRIVDEFNAFCEGKHPRYPGLRLDGTAQSGLDLRVSLANSGSWYRDDGRTAIVWGTTRLEEELKAAGCGFTEYLKQAGCEHLEVCDGQGTVFQDLRRRTEGSCSIALRDYWPFWHKFGEKGIYGKPLFVDRSEGNRLDLFFDDCITLGEEDTKIVDVRDGKDGRPIWPVYAHKYYLCRAEPLNAILDDRYFLKKVEQKEEAHQKRNSTREKVRRLFSRSVVYNRLTSFSMDVDTQEEDTWQKDKLLCKAVTVSMLHAFSDDSEEDSDEEVIKRGSTVADFRLLDSDDDSDLNSKDSNVGSRRPSKESRSRRLNSKDQGSRRSSRERDGPDGNGRRSSREKD